MNEDILFDKHIENEYDQVLTQEDMQGGFEQEQEQEQEQEKTVSENQIPQQSVSDNNIQEDILIELRGLRSDVQSLREISVSSSVSSDILDSNIVSDNTLSRNIINTSINDYTISESIGLMILGALFIGSLVYVIRRCVIKWR